MASERMICLFCLNQTNDAFSLHGSSVITENARQIISKHFWFDIDDFSSTDSYTCFKCWHQIKSFHQFYVNVEAIYSQSSSMDSDAATINELDSNSSHNFDDNHEKIVELEIDFLASDTHDVRYEDETSRGSSIKLLPLFNETTSEERGSCAEIEINSKHCEENAPKKIKILKMQTIEQIICYMCQESFAGFWQLQKHMSCHNKKRSRLELERNAYMNFQEKLPESNGDDTKLKNNTKIPCSICGKKFKSKNLLGLHAMTHVDRKLTEVQCEICSKWMKNRNILHAHETIHEIKELQCPHCDKIKFNERSLGSHILQCHSTQKKHQCSICSKSFSRPSKLKEHAATHTGKALYRCSYCFQSFKSTANMYKHLKVRHLKQWNLDRAKKQLE